MGDDITATRGWEEQGQRACHDRAVSPHRWQVITAGPAGTAMVDTGCRPGEICWPGIGTGPGHQRPAPAAGSSGRSWRQQGAPARTWFPAC
jgi:hypothetical protein